MDRKSYIKFSSLSEETKAKIHEEMKAISSKYQETAALEQRLFADEEASNVKVQASIKGKKITFTFSGSFVINTAEALEDSDEDTKEDFDINEAAVQVLNEINNILEQEWDNGVRDNFSTLDLLTGNR